MTNSSPIRKSDVTIAGLRKRFGPADADALVGAEIGWIWETDAENRYTYLSKNFEALSGLAKAGVLGTNRLDLFTDSAGENSKFRTHSADVTARKPFSNFVFETRDAQGRSQWLSVCGVPRFGKDGAFTGYAGTGRNVTETIAAHDEADQFRREVEKTSAMLTATCDELDAGLIVFDSEDRLLLANPAMKDLFPGIARILVPGTVLRDVVTAMHDTGQFKDQPRDRQSWIEAQMAAYYGASSETELQLSDGRWVHQKITRRENGLLIGLCIDITDIKLRESQLQEVVEKTKLAEEILNGIDQAIAVKDSDYRYVFVNDKFAALSKRPRSVFIGKNAWELFPPDQAEDFESTEKLVLDSGSLQEMEEDFFRENRHQSRIVRKNLVTMESGRKYVAISLINITELKQRERLLEEAQQKAMLSDRAKSEFLANMSHEIRTPMNGVLGMAELLTKTSLDTKQKTFTDIIVKSGNALLTIINDILDFSKIDAGQMVLDPAPFDIAEAVEDVATLVSTRAKEKDLELIVRIDPAMPRFFIGDVGRIRQIITNLMGNAVKFTERGHVLIDITGRESGDRWRLDCKVVDTGIGIPEDKLGIIFEKFSQVDGSSTRRHEGTGLGLAITSKLVELMGGQIDASSALGEGSTFVFAIDLPRYDGVLRELPTAPVDVTGARVLIIDDNAVNCEILIEQMKAWKFDACAAESGKLGIAVLEAAKTMKCPVDLVILDFQMPDMNGGEVLAAIRGNPVIRDVPIIMLTSVDQALSSDMLRAYEVDQHLLKPARSAHLLDAISSGIKRHRLAKLAAPQPADGVQAQASATAEDQALAAPNPKPGPDDAPGPKTPAEEAKQPAAPWERSALDILVAEDNEVNQLVYTQILSDLPYTFEIVANGKLAVEAFREHGPRIVLMDVSMPEMNGLEATAAIRQLAGGDVPIIGVTAHALKGDQERCIAAGMDDYLSKPISPDTLATKIRHWLEKRQSASVG